MARAKEACRTSDRLWMAFAPSGHRRSLPLGRRLLDWESAEKEMSLRAAIEPRDVVAATSCDGRDCLRFEAVDRREAARREDSSLGVIVVASGSHRGVSCCWLCEGW